MRELIRKVRRWFQVRRKLLHASEVFHGSDRWLMSVEESTWRGKSWVTIYKWTPEVTYRLNAVADWVQMVDEDEELERWIRLHLKPHRHAAHYQMGTERFKALGR